LLGRLVWPVAILAIGIGSILAFRLPPMQFAQDIGTQAFAPLQWSLAGPVQTVSDVLSTIQNVGELRAENARLREEVDQLVGESARAQELERENQELREQLGFKRENPSLEWLSAQVIYSDPSNLVQSVTINVGNRDGVKQGMTVVTPRGLAGRIVQVSQNTSRVLLITDASSSVAAVIQDSRARGVISGQRRELLTMKYIPQSETIRTGERVVTSGAGGVFPEGILIGRIADVTRKDVDMFQEAQVEPEVDFARLDRVLVVTNHLPLNLD